MKLIERINKDIKQRGKDIKRIKDLYKPSTYGLRKKVLLKEIEILEEQKKRLEKLSKHNPVVFKRINNENETFHMPNGNFITYDGQGTPIEYGQITPVGAWLVGHIEPNSGIVYK